MNNKTFNTLIAFTDAIGAGRKPKHEVIELARKVLVYGDKRLIGVGDSLRRNAQGLVKSLDYKHSQLIKFKDSETIADKLEVYKQFRSNVPSEHTVSAVIDVLSETKTIAKARTYYGVNHAAISSIVARFKVWEGLADEL